MPPPFLVDPPIGHQHSQTLAASPLSLPPPSLQLVRRRRFRRVRAAVGGRLFLAKPAFQPALLELGAAAAEMRRIPFCAAFPASSGSALGGAGAGGGGSGGGGAGGVQAAHACPCASLRDYGDAQAAAREARAKPAVEALVERVQKARAERRSAAAASRQDALPSCLSTSVTLSTTSALVYSLTHTHCPHTLL